MKPAKRVLLVGRDAADWRLLNALVESDDVPHLAEQAARGAMGNLFAKREQFPPSGLDLGLEFR